MTLIALAVVLVIAIAAYTALYIYKRKQDKADKLFYADLRKVNEAIASSERKQKDEEENTQLEDFLAKIRDLTKKTYALAEKLREINEKRRALVLRETLRKSRLTNRSEIRAARDRAEELLEQLSYCIVCGKRIERPKEGFNGQNRGRYCQQCYDEGFGREDKQGDGPNNKKVVLNGICMVCRENEVGNTDPFYCTSCYSDKVDKGWHDKKKTPQ
jgi:hypothetical protein